MATQWLGGLFDQTASLIVANSLHVYAGSFGQRAYRDFHDRTHTVRALHMGVAVVTWIGVNPAVYIFSNAIPPVLGDLPWVVMLLIVNAFVVHNGRLELMLRRNSLQRRIAAVLKVVRGSIPIHDESLDVEIFGVLNLLSKDIRVLRVIADIDVSRTSKPRLIRSDDLRTALRSRDFRAQRPSDVGTPRSGASRQTKESYGAGEKTKTLKSPE